MDTKEFAKVLLCEATELLESAGSNGLSSKFAHKMKLKYGKEDEFVKHLEPDLELKKYKKDLTQSIARYHDTKHKGLIPDEEISKIDQNVINGINAIKTSNNYQRDRLLSYIDSRTKKSNPIHKKIEENVKRSEAKKPNNECTDLAVLLTEAALLLNEGIFPNRKKEKSSNIPANIQKIIDENDRVIKESEKKNKELVDYFNKKLSKESKDKKIDSGLLEYFKNENR